MMTYRGCEIAYNPKPIRCAVGFCSEYRVWTRGHDWEWQHPDYDGAPDSPNRNTHCGTAGSEQECREQIDKINRAAAQGL